MTAECMKAIISNSWDSDYWLSYNLDSKTTTDPNLSGSKPEPDKELFKRFAQTGENGGGFCSPQAPGYAMLYYSLDHLAILDPLNTSLNESDYVNQVQAHELDTQGRIKQPWSNKISTGNTRSSKLINEWLNPYDGRWSGIWANNPPTVVPPTLYGGDPEAFANVWRGRAKYNRNQSHQASSKLNVFGPYTIRPGDKLRYALAEVCGYGADSAKFIEGGLATVSVALNTQWSIIPGMNKKVVIGGEVMTERYLTDFGYPDYVNSNVRTVQQVAHKAFRAYLGHDPTVPVWPENNPR